METVFATPALAGSEGFAGFRDAIRRRFLPIDLSRTTRGVFRSAIQQRLAREFSFTRIACDPVIVTCDASSARQAPQGSYLLRFQIAGWSTCMQYGRQARLDRGCFMLIDPAAPYCLTNGAIECFIVGLPREVVDEHLKDARHYCAIPFRGDTAAVRAAYGMFSLMAEEAGHLEGAELRHVARAALALIAPGIRRSARGRRAQRQDRRELRRRIDGFIEMNLPDPCLGPRTIAEAAGISTRTLFKLFESSGCTVSERIRTLRLTRCREALLDPARRSQSITEIAFECGFSDAAHFSRCFRSRFGVSPKALRSAS